MGSRYFLHDPLKCFLPKMERKLSGDEFFLNWQKYPCACAHGLLQFAFFFFIPCADIAFFVSRFFFLARLPLLFIIIFLFFWFSRPGHAFLLLFSFSLFFFSLLLGWVVTLPLYLFIYFFWFSRAWVCWFIYLFN